jgi:hypothetical protein
MKPGSFQSYKKQVVQWYKQQEAAAVKDFQSTIDAITVKAQDKEVKAKITASEKVFLQTLYHAIGAGGNAKGFHEAAALMRHYLGEEGRKGGNFEIDSGIYQNSNVVKKEVERQKVLARAALKKGKGPFKGKSGKLLADYARLKYADNRFILNSVTKPLAGGSFETVWRVDNSYDFEDFQGSSTNWKKASKWSEFPVRGYKVIIYDGLSRYLVNLGMAEEFDYFAEWTETWK